MSAGRPRRESKQSKAASVSDDSRDYADLAGADLRKADFSGVRLRFATLTAARLDGADMSRADLLHAQIDRARLDGASLSEARLEHANLTGADLTEANLTGAGLRFAILRGACLRGADLSGANLLHARFDQADLSGADFTGAKLDHAVFAGAVLAGANLCGVNLRYARNLTQAQIAEARTDAKTILPAVLEEQRRIPLAASAPRGGHGLARGRGDRAAAGLAALLVAAATSIGTGLRSPRVLLSGALAIAALAGVFGWWYFKLEELEPSDATERLQAAAWPPHVIAGVAAGPSLRSPRKIATAPERAPDVVPSVPPAAAETGTPAPGVRLTAAQAPDLIEPASRPPSLAAFMDIDASLPINVAFEQVRRVAPASAPLEAAMVRGLMRPVPLAKAMRARPMKLVKVSLKLPLLEELEHPVTAAVPELAALTAREVREDAAGLVEPPPMTLVVSLDNQTIDVYRGTSLLETSKVSSGMPGHETRPGVFSILQKKEYHESNLYSAAPMPWMQRLTRSGIALHAGVVPGHPASHGCVRLPKGFATKLFEMTEIGANVVVAKDAVVPRPIEHPNLFRPLAKSELAAWEARQGSAAYPGSGSINAPLRLLVARRTLRDEVLDVQRLLAELGYLKPRQFLGQMEGDTRGGIAAFQKTHKLPMTGLFTLALAAKVHEVAGKEKPPVGHLFVRQDFHRLYDLPVAYRDPDDTLGTHVFTLHRMDSQTGQAEWLAVSLEGDDSSGVLDRIEIPEAIRQDIAARLTPGSTLIVAQFADDSPILPEGDDFIVWTGDEWSGEPSVAVNAPASEPEESAAPVARKRMVEPRRVAAPRQP
jgi:uncharacterized protein YjbI with pentapeptide repeats/lipoprotein-anchoring transpeptidase ErfK/SrfK